MTAGDAAGRTAGARFGVRSMSAPLRRVLLRRPSVSGDFTAAAWRTPDAGLLASQHEAFGQLLTDLGCEVEVAPAADGLVDATYVRDPGLVTGAGAVLFQMAKPAREAEPPLLAAALSEAGVPVVAQLCGSARADGGDFIWLDERTMLAGRSYRTNAEGLRQLAEILASRGRQSGIGRPPAPSRARARAAPDVADLTRRRRSCRRLPATGAGHADADARRACGSGGAGRRRRVRDDGVQRLGRRAQASGHAERQPPDPRRTRVSRGCEVHGYDGSEISLKGDGGPTCLTAPIWRGGTN